MSEEQLKAFLEAVKADAGLQEQLKGVVDLAAVVAIAKSAGFLISAEDLRMSRDEISEEELDGVSGGGLRPTKGWCRIPTDSRPDWARGL